MKTRNPSLLHKLVSSFLTAFFATGPVAGPAAQAVAAEAPVRLDIRADPVGNVTLSWTSSLPSLRLEQAATVGACTPWRPVAVLPTQAGDEHSVTLPATEAARFFQLYSPPESNFAPALCPIGDRIIAVGETLAFDVEATDLNRDPLTFQVAPLPLVSNSTYQPQGNHFRFTPSGDQHGQHTFTFSVSDGVTVDSETITVTVTGPPLRIRTLVGNRLQISWPASASTFVLEENSTFAPTGWTPVSIAPIVQSDRLTVNFNATAAARFYRLRAGDDRVNHPPSLAPVPNRTVALGDAVAFALAASDPDGDLLTFAVTPLPLPVGASFNSQSGVFSFRPQPDQTNNDTYPLTFTVSDGMTNVSRSAAITVTNLSPGITSLRGQVVTTGRAPLPNVRIEVGTNAINPQAFSDANGDFVITNTPSGRQRVLIDGSTVGNANTYATVPEMIDLIPGAMNALDPPIVLLPLDAASADHVSSNAMSVVDSSPVMIGTNIFPPIVLTVPANSAHNEFTGQPFDGMVHISRIPDPTLGPRPLPPDMVLSVYVALQPFGVTYNPPARISFPNVENFPPGSIVDIVGLNHNTGMMQKVGEARVSGDGRTVDSIGGVIHNNSWHGFVPQPPIQERDDSPSGNPNGCQRPIESSFEVQTGDLSEDHVLPSYRSRGVRRSLRLVYRSKNAEPGPVIPFLTSVGNATPPPLTMSTVLRVGGVVQGLENFFLPDPNAVFTPNRPARQFDGRAYASDSYAYDMTVNCNFPISLRSGTLSGLVTVRNEADSPFGAGWTLEGLDRIKFISVGVRPGTDLGRGVIAGVPGAGLAAANLPIGGAPSTPVLVFVPIATIFTGDGASLRFVDFRSPEGDFSSLTRNPDRTFTRVLKDGTRHEFDSRGLQAVRIDRNGNATSYQYDAQERLARITDPAGLQTELSYGGNGKLASVTDPAGRTTYFIHDADGNLTRISEPNGAARFFGYRGHLLTSQINQRGYQTRYEYDFAKHFRRTIMADGSTVRAFVADSANLVNAADGIGTPLAPAPPPTQKSAVATVIVDGNGNTNILQTDRFGAATRSIDALGRVTATIRDANSLPTSITRPNTAVSSYSYDARGNLLTATEQAIAATTALAYESTFNQVTNIIDPKGNPTRLRYDANGNPIEIADAKGTRTVLRYENAGCPGQLTSVTAAFGLPEETTTRFEYDPVTCNLFRTINPLGSTNTLAYDAAGNVVRSTDAEGRVTRYQYDALNRLTKVLDATTTAPNPPCGTPGVTCYQYDPRGNLTAVTDARGSITRFEYDARDRVSASIDPLGHRETFAYDFNGNLLATTNRNGQVIRYQYDAADRLVRKIVEPGTAKEVPTSYRYDIGDGLTRIDAPDNALIFTNDLVGRLVSAQTVIAPGPNPAMMAAAMGQADAVAPTPPAAPLLPRPLGGGEGRGEGEQTPDRVDGKECSRVSTGNSPEVFAGQELPPLQNVSSCAERLECGDLSPLSHGTPSVDVDSQVSRARDSGDKSPHSKRWRDLAGSVRFLGARSNGNAGSFLPVPDGGGEGPPVRLEGKECARNEADNADDAADALPRPLGGGEGRGEGDEGVEQPAAAADDVDLVPAHPLSPAGRQFQRKGVFPGAIPGPNTITWVGTTSGFWDDTNNWNTHTLPGPTNDVIIDVAAAITVTHRSGTTLINTLQSTKPIELTGGTLTISNTAQLSANLTLNGGSLSGGIVNLTNGARVSASANSVSRLDAVTIIGALDLTNFAARVKIEGGTTFTTAHLGNSGGLGFAPGSVLTGHILADAPGGGSVGMNGNAGTLTIAPGASIRILANSSGINVGDGWFGGAMTLVNQGLLSAEAPGNYLNLTPAAFTNHGTVRASGGAHLNISNLAEVRGVSMSGGGQLNLYGNYRIIDTLAVSNSTLVLYGTWANAGTLAVTNTTLYLAGTCATTNLGVIQRSGGTVYLAGTLHNTNQNLVLDAATGPWALLAGEIHGGTVTLLDGLQLSATVYNANRLLGVTVNGDLDLTSSSARLRIEGGTTFTTAHLGNNGGLGFAPGSVLTGHVLFDTPDGGGYVGMNGGAGTLTIAPGASIRALVNFGNVNVGDDGWYGGAMALINHGLLSAEAPNSSLRLNPSACTNHGTILGTNQANLYIDNLAEVRGVSMNGGRQLSLSGTYVLTDTLAVNDSTLVLLGNWANTGTLAVSNTTVYLAGIYATTNLGNIQRAGGTIYLNGSLNNSNQNLVLDAATGPWVLWGEILGGTVTLSNDVPLQIAASSANRLVGVTVNGDLDVTASSARVKIEGGTTFGTALVGNNSGLGFAPGSVLTGEILAEGTGYAIVEMNGNNGTFTVAPGASIRALPGFSGTLYVGPANWFGGSMTLINQGLISGEAAGSTLSLQPAAFTNNGTVRASGGAHLQIYNLAEVRGVSMSGGGTFNLHGNYVITDTLAVNDSTLVLFGNWANAGTLAVSNTTVYLAGTYATTNLGNIQRAGGTIYLNGTLNNTNQNLVLDAATGPWVLIGGEILGGTVTLSNDVPLQIAASSANRLVGVAVNGDLDLRTFNGARVKIEGGTTFRTALVGNNSGLGFAPGSVLTGEILAEGTGYAIVEMNGNNGTFTVAPGASIRALPGFSGTLYVGPANWFGGSMTLINQGLISGEAAGSTLSLQPAAFTNNGTVRASGGAHLQIYNLAEVRGVSMSGGGTFNLHGNYVITDTLAVNDSTLVLFGNWANAGTLAVSNTTVYLAGTYATTNLGNIQRAGGTIYLNGTLNNTNQNLVLDAATGPWVLIGGEILGGTVTLSNDVPLQIAASSANRLVGVAVNGDLDLRTFNGARVKIEGGTTFRTALVGNNSGLGFAPGSVLTGEILAEGTGYAIVEMNGNNGTFTVAPGASIRALPGFSGTLYVGPANWFGGSMTLINQGLISGEAAGSTLSLQPAAFTNNGTVRASGGAHLQIYNLAEVRGVSMSGGGTFNLHGNYVITDTLAVNDSTLVLFGNWANAGTLAVSNTTVYLAGTYATTNLGNIQRAGGTIYLNGTLNNTNQNLVLDAATGPWVLIGGEILGGTVTLSNDVPLQIAASSANRLVGVAVNGDLDLRTFNGARVKIEGGTTFRTALVGNNSGLGFAPGSVLTGEILAEGTGYAIVEMNGNNGTFTVAPGASIRALPGFSGTLYVGPANWFGGSMTLINQGLISGEAAGSTLSLQPAAFTNNGTVRASGGAHLQIYNLAEVRGVSMSGGGTFNLYGNYVLTDTLAVIDSTLVLNGAWANAGTLAVSNTTVYLGGTYATTNLGNIQRTGGAVYLYGSLNNSNQTLVLDAATGPWVLIGGQILGGTVSLLDGQQLACAASTANKLVAVSVNGDIVLPDPGSYVAIEGGATFNNARLRGSSSRIGFAPGSVLTGHILFETTGGNRQVEVTGAGGTLTIAPDASIRAAPQSAPFSLDWIGGSERMTLINHGLISADGPGARLYLVATMQTNLGTVQVLDGGFMQLFRPFTNSPGGILGGRGTLHGNVINAGDLNPGDPLGTLFINGDLTQTASGKLNFQFGGSVGCDEFDRLVVSGSVNLGGTLNLMATNNCAPTLNQMFSVLGFASRNGDFATVNGLTSLDRSYTTNGMVLTQTDSSTLNVTLTYAYDKNGNRTAMTDPTGVTTYTYDELNRLVALTNSSNLGITFAYDALGRRTRMNYPNGVETTYAYDAASQLLGLVHRLGATTNSAFFYGYNRVGNRTNLTQIRTGLAVNPSLTYVYDPLDQLVQATHPLPGRPDETFLYDPVGNRLRRDGQTMDAVHDAANRLLEDQDFRYAYDLNGNLTNKVEKANGATTRYTFDAENKLRRVDLPDGGVAAYRYDAIERRLEKSFSQQLVRYLYDRSDILMEFSFQTNALAARYTHGPGFDEPLIMQRDLDRDGVFETSERFSYAFDALGSVTELANSGGAVTRSSVYDSFGQIASDLGTTPNPYAYTGREFDSEVGLLFYRARFLDARAGRFLSEDPIRMYVKGRNHYKYVNNNPVNLIDPLGWDAEKCPRETDEPDTSKPQYCFAGRCTRNIEDCSSVLFQGIGGGGVDCVCALEPDTNKALCPSKKSDQAPKPIVR